MAIFLDILVVSCVVLMIVIGYKRGFLRTAASLLSFVAALLLAGFLSTPFASWTFDTFISDGLSKTVEEHLDVTDTASIARSLEVILDQLPAPFSNALTEMLGTPQQMTEKLGEAADAGADKIADGIVQKLIRPVAVTLLRLLWFLALFVLLTVVLSLLLRLISGLFERLPLVRQINGLLGALAGIVQGVLLAFVLTAVFQCISLSSSPSSAITTDTLEDTALVSRMMDISPLSGILETIADN